MISYRKFVEWLNRPLYQLRLFIRAKSQERHLGRMIDSDRSNLYRFPKLKGSQAVPPGDFQVPVPPAKATMNQRHSFKRAR